MPKVNIGPAGDGDAFFRYKRDTIQVKYNQTNGCTTCLLNLTDISRQLKLPSFSKFERYIQKQLGLPQFVDGCVTGKVLPIVIEASINKYISRHVLCPRETCRLPEWDSTEHHCKACGYTRVEQHGEENTIVGTIEYKPTKTLDDEVCKWMHLLYNRRLELTGSNRREVDRMLDKCWLVTSAEKWRQQLLPRIEILLS